MSAWRFSVHESMYLVVLVRVLVTGTILLQSLIAASSANASFLVDEQASRSNNTTDKEIAFVSFNGNLRNDNKPKPKAKTQPTTVNATSVAATVSEPFQVHKRGRRYLDLLDTTRMFVGIIRKFI